MKFFIYNLLFQRLVKYFNLTQILSTSDSTKDQEKQSRNNINCKSTKTCSIFFYSLIEFIHLFNFKEN